MKAIAKSDCGFEKTSQILENNYPEIHKALQSDEYSIQYEELDVFCEITHENEVVGFYTFEQVEPHTSIINEIYILKNHRGNNLCIETLIDTFSIPNMSFLIRNPNYNLIKVLLKNDFAIRCDDEIIYSFFDFAASSSDLYRNPNIKRLYRQPDGKELFSANFYNDKLKCLVTASEENGVTKQEGTLMIFEPRKNDLKKYKLRKKLKKVTIASLENIMEKIYFSLEETEKFENETAERLVELNSIDMLLEQTNTDKKEEIRKSIEKSLDNGQLLQRYVKIRLAYLIENPDRIEREADMSLLPNKCPFCENELLLTENVCPVCGFLNMEIDEDVLFIDGDEKLYREVMDMVFENDWDSDEIFDLQCLCGTYEFIKMSKIAMYFPIEKVDVSNKVKKGSVAEYGLKHGYLKELSYDDYIDMIENEYDRRDLKIEVEHYGLKPKITKRGMIKQIKEVTSSENQSVIYVESQKGKELYENCEILEYYMDYVRTFLFCEFKKFVDAHDYPLDEACEKFINLEYQKGIEKKNWRVYKQLLKYRIEKNEDPDEHLKLAIQTLIYDINCDDLNDDMGLGYELDSALYIMEGLMNSNTYLDETFEKAYNEFELEELKGKKQECHDAFIDICEGKSFKEMTKFIASNRDMN